MINDTDAVGGRRALEQLLIGEEREISWARLVVRFWGFLFVGFVLLFVWLPVRMTASGERILFWMVGYVLYLLCLEILCWQNRQLYESSLFRLFRIQFNFLMIALLIWLVRPSVYSYLWFFFSLPLFAVILYFDHPLPIWTVFIEVCATNLVLHTLLRGTTPLSIAVALGQDAILGLLAGVLYFSVRSFPWLRRENTLLEAVRTVLGVLDQNEVCQLLADAAKSGIPASDSAVVHLVSGEDKQVLKAIGSSNIDLTTLGRTPMRVGEGIAGHAISERQTLNVPDVNNDPRYLELLPSFTSFESLLVAPMYVGDKNVGSISVNSATKGAFNTRDANFLTALAAQGATALANVELYDARTSRRRQISDILEASLGFSLNQPLDSLLRSIAIAVCECTGYQMAVVNLLDATSNSIVVEAMAGVPPEGRRKLRGLRIPFAIIEPLLQKDFRLSSSYFIRHDRCPEIPRLDEHTFTANLDAREPGEWHADDMLIVPIRTREEELLGYISVDDPVDRQLPSLDTVQALEVLASVSATAIQNARLYEEQQRRSALLKLINEVGKQIGAVLKLDDVLDKATESICQRFGYDSAAVFMMDKTGKDLILRAIYGIHGEVDGEYRQKIGQGIIGWVAQQGRMLLANDVSEEPLFLQLLPEENRTRSELTVPIKAGDETIGVLDVQSSKQNSFDRLDVEAMERVADQLAVAVENARLYQATRQRANELDVVREVGLRFAGTLNLDGVLSILLDELQELLDVMASVWLVDQPNGQLICRRATGYKSEQVEGWRLAPGEGLAGWVARCGESLIVPDTRVDERYCKRVEQSINLPLRSVLTVPLQVKQKTIGVLQLVDTEVNRFTREDQRLMETLASTAAVAIANARLYEEAEKLRIFNENIVQNMEEGILLEDPTGHIAFINRKTSELLGYAQSELEGEHYSITVAPEELEKVEEKAIRRPEGFPGRYETKLLTKGGDRVPVIVSATPLFDGGKFKGVLTVFTDITARKRQETRLLDYLSEVTDSLAHHTSLKGLYEFVVESGCRLLSARNCVLFLAHEPGGKPGWTTVSASSLCGREASAEPPPANRLACNLVERVAETREPIRLTGDEIQEHPLCDEKGSRTLCSDLGYPSSFLATPMLTAEEELAGVLVALDSEGGEGFSDFDQVLIQTLATNAAADIERVKGVERVRENAVQAERKRLETDLHEAMNILATGVRWESEILSDHIPTSEQPAQIALKRLQAAVSRAYTDLRYLLEDLRDPTLARDGLVAALKSRAELMGRGRIEVEGQLRSQLPPTVQGILYRVGQEAMSNAIKHSGVLEDPDVKIRVSLESRNGQVRLCVIDDGIGFDVESTLDLSHKWGLRRLQDSLREMGGSLAIDSEPGRGTRICASIDIGNSHGK